MNIEHKLNLMIEFILLHHLILAFLLIDKTLSFIVFYLDKKLFLRYTIVLTIELSQF